MNKKTIKTLEFDKITERLAQHAVMDITKAAVRKLRIETDINKVNIMQTETAQGCELITKKGNPPIFCAEDIRSSVKRSELSGVLSPKELYSIARMLKTARYFKVYPDDIECNTLSEHFEALYTDKALEQRIFSIIIDENTIADNASPELSDIRRRIKTANKRVKDALSDIISSQKYAKCLQEQIVTMRGDRYVIPVKSEYRGEIKGILHDTSATGATLFIEPVQVVDANNEIRQLTIAEDEEVKRILAELSSNVADLSKVLLMTYSIISELDLIFARSKYSLAIDGFRPVLNDKGYINLEKARHPLIDPKKVVPSDIRVGKEFDTLVITGPNTGGKTVVLKTCGLLTLMAQAGLHIPAREGSVIAVFKNIFADIGDEQSIEQSLSTFSSHMVNIVDILSQVGGGSCLCLFDELGAGTDPVEGASLAVSILEKVRRMGAKTLATTHYSELKMYALGTDRVENGSCEFDVETLAPTYKLLIGIPGRSNAFAISKKLGLSDEIIEEAKNHMASESIKFEDVITQLEETRRDMQEQKEKADAYKRDAEKLKTDTANTNRLLKSKTDKIIERARMEAKQILDEAKEEADEIIKEMRKVQHDADTKAANTAAENARRKLTEKAKKNSALLSESMFKTDASFKPPKSVKPGDDVEIVKLGQKGVVVTAPDDKGDIMVKVGIMKIKSNISDIRLVNEPKPKQTGPRRSEGKVPPSKTMTLSAELDVRGENVDTACMMVDKFLDDAIMSSLSQVRIVHGKGTGVLRHGIHQYLRSLKHVKSFRLGVFGEGDSGVTVVEL